MVPSRGKTCLRLTTCVLPWEHHSSVHPVSLHHCPRATLLGDFPSVVGHSLHPRSDPSRPTSSYHIAGPFPQTTPAQGNLITQSQQLASCRHSSALSDSCVVFRALS
jgi:hypothetical protein